MKRTSRLVVSIGPLALLAVTALGGCTTLGPMPATTGIAALPNGRPGVEVQAGIVPGYVLSGGTQQEPQNGDPSSQVLALVEPDRWLGTRGVIAGARNVGREGDNAFEPFLGYRHRLDDNFAVAVVGYGASMGNSNQGASYHANRAGAEIAADARIFAPVSWLALHAQAAVSATYLHARGTYCVDASGWGTDCDQDASDHTADGSVRGLFAAATASLALDLGRLPQGPFHGARIALLGAAGAMPTLHNGVETGGTHYASLGLTLTLGVGER